MTMPHPSLLPGDGELSLLHEPLALAAFRGWNDGAATATNALRYLRGQWGAAEVASTDPDRFYDLTVARPNRRIVNGEQVLRWPSVRFYSGRPPGAARDVLTIAGREPALRWREFTEVIASVLEAVGARKILLVGTRSALVPHTRPAAVVLSDGSEYFEQLLGLTSEPRSAYQGAIGVGTALLLALRERGIDVARLTVLVPSYIGGGPNPRAVLALVEVLGRALGSPASLDALRQQVEAFNDQVANVIAGVENPAELRTQIEQMERAYDAQPRTVERSDLPQSDELFRHVEQILREGLEPDQDQP